MDKHRHWLKFRLKLINPQNFQTFLIVHTHQRFNFSSVLLDFFLHFSVLFLINLFTLHILGAFDNNPYIRIRRALHFCIDEIEHLFINLISEKLIIDYFGCMAGGEDLPSFKILVMAELGYDVLEFCVVVG